jgi:hypothetical protein
MNFELKPIVRESIPRALEKAERYRFLNEPFLAESICLDVLAIEPSSQKALMTYVLALTDQFQSGIDGGVERARAAIAKLEGEFERHYYEGLVCERRGQAQAEAGGMGAKDAAWEWITDAMEAFEKAHAVRPSGNDDAILRWNTCVRLIDAHRLSAPPPGCEREQYGSE